MRNRRRYRAALIAAAALAIAGCDVGFDRPPLTAKQVQDGLVACAAADLDAMPVIRFGGEIDSVKCIAHRPLPARLREGDSDDRQ